MIDFRSFPFRLFVRAILALMVGGITVGGSVGLQFAVLKGSATEVPVPLTETKTPDLNAQDSNIPDVTTPDTNLPGSSENEPRIEGWPSLLYPSSSTPDSPDNGAIESTDVEERATDAMEEAERLPEPLTMMLQRIDQAASSENIDEVMMFYSDDLQHSDGITTKEFKAMLTEFWATYDNLSYSTEVTDWQAADNEFITTTTTTVTGQKVGAHRLTFEATMESRQVIRDRQIIEQDVLAESSQIRLGETPPTVNVNLPNTVRPGETFYFDVIVQEPIGNSLLMGTAFSDPVSLDTFRTVPLLDVSGLGAGGLFKVGDAPLDPGQEWVSGLVIREDGITGVTQRLRIVGDR